MQTFMSWIRKSISIALTFLILMSTVHATDIVAVRTWPSEDYTRITIEYDGALREKHFLLSGPDRLVVDLEGITLDDKLKAIAKEIYPDDPHIKQARIGQLTPQTVRLVLDLKTKINPQVFSLQPFDKYNRRLVVDLYPQAQNKTPLVQDWLPAITQGKTQSQTQTQPAQKVAVYKPSRPRVQRLITIVVDPGHGGEDSGAIGATGSKEKDVVLAISRRLKKRLEQQPNTRVVMTRNADFFVPLGMRVQKARQAQADLFISIHADAFQQQSARGSSVFVLSEKGATSVMAKWLAKRENDADLLGGVNIKKNDAQLSSVLLDLSTTAQINSSLKLGRAVLSEMGSINTLHKGSVEQAAFAVLKAPDIPSILVETAFISNPEEEAKLHDEQHQENIAKAIVNGVNRYFEKNAPNARNGMI